MRLVEQDRPLLRMVAQDRGDQRARAAADVCDDRVRTEVVRAELVSVRPGGGPHGRVERAACLGMEAPVLPHVHPERVGRRVLARADAVVERTPRCPFVVRAEHLGHRRDRQVVVGPQVLTRRVVLERVPLELGEDADRCERTEQSVERRRMGVGAPSELFDRLRTVGKEIRDAQSRGNGERLRTLIAAGDPHQVGELTRGHASTLPG